MEKCLLQIKKGKLIHWLRVLYHNEFFLLGENSEYTNKIQEFCLLPKKPLTKREQRNTIQIDKKKKGIISL